PHAPSRMSLPRTGRRPCSTHGRTRSSVAPSRPITSSGAATPGSVDVPEGAEPFLGGCVVAPLLARPGLGGRLDARWAQLGAQGLRRRRLRRPYVAHLAGIADDVEERLGGQTARVVAVGRDQLPLLGAHRLQHVPLEVFLGEDALAHGWLPVV